MTTRLRTVHRMSAVNRAAPVCLILSETLVFINYKLASPLFADYDICGLDVCLVIGSRDRIEVEVIAGRRAFVHDEIKQVAIGQQRLSGTVITCELPGAAVEGIGDVNVVSIQQSE